MEALPHLTLDPGLPLAALAASGMTEDGHKKAARDRSRAA
jgi:hypothetical protein